MSATGTEPALLPTPTPFVHQVEADDTLLGIAIRYGLTLDQLLAANPGIDPRFLSIGQELRIPGPDGEAPGGLLPTSTPLPLPLVGTACYPTAGGRLMCLATLVNDTESPLEGLTAQITLLSPENQVLDSQLAYAPLNLLPPGARMPLSAAFDLPDEAEVRPRISLLSAFESLSADQRYPITQLEDVLEMPDSTGASWRVSGRLDLAEAADDGAAIRAGVLAMALDSAGNVVG
jgi:LysM repeat protein